MKEESEKASLKLNIQKTKIMASGPITSWDTDVEKGEAVTDFLFLGSKITADSLCDTMNRSTPGLPVHHQLPEFTQTHVHRVSDAIQPSHPLLS